MTEEIDRFEKNIKKIDSIIKGIEAEADKETCDNELSKLEKKLTHFQEYKASLETRLSIIKGE